MGYISHNGILLTSLHKEIEEARDKAIELGMVVSEIQESNINGYRSFAVFPHGSKEGWEAADEGDYQRDSFVKYLKKFLYPDGGSSIAWVEVQYGNDDYITKVVRDSDERMRGKNGSN